MLNQLFQVPDHIAHLKLCNRPIHPPVPPPPLHMHPLLHCHKVISLFLLLQLTIVILVLRMQDMYAVLLLHTQVPKMCSPLSVPHTMIPIIVRHTFSERHRGHRLPTLLHFSLLRSLALLLSTLVILGIHPLAMTNNIHHRPTG